LLISTSYPLLSSPTDAHYCLYFNIYFSLKTWLILTLQLFLHTIYSSTSFCMHASWMRYRYLNDCLVINNSRLYRFILYIVNVQFLQIIYVMQSRTTVINSCMKTSVFISYYFRCLNWWSCWLYVSSNAITGSLFRDACPGTYSKLSFLNVTVFHYNVYTIAVYN
jgi:hypothetical protein